MSKKVIGEISKTAKKSSGAKIAHTKRPMVLKVWYTPSPKGTGYFKKHEAFIDA